MIILDKDTYDFDDLLEIMCILRAPNGCPWDKEQTHESIRKNFIEEVYEVCEAIDLKSDAMLCEELGDVLLQVVFHARIAQDRGAFSISDVCSGICRKLILRHPHIFSDVSLNTSEQVLEQWDAIKRKEKHQKSVSESLEQIAKTLPALMYAEKVLKKAEKSGMGIKPDKPQTAEERIGAELMRVVEEARELGVDPEKALADAAKKYIGKFSEADKHASVK